jgi:hypothetical protein
MLIFLLEFYYFFFFEAYLVGYLSTNSYFCK